LVRSLRAQINSKRAQDSRETWKRVIDRIGITYPEGGFRDRCGNGERHRNPMIPVTIDSPAGQFATVDLCTIFGLIDIDTHLS
jgi:hypothetical protein